MVKKLNEQLFDEAKKYLSGGVNSPIRSFKAVGGPPIFIKSAKGSRIYAEDGREFIDYCLSWGALILGHAHKGVIDNLKKAIDKGTSFGAPTRLETELAKLIIDGIPSIEKLRFTNSGTEAVMGAVRLARAYTGKTKLIKFEGSYHGHADYLLNCPGIPEDFRKHTLIACYNDIKGLEALVRANRDNIAAIIVEPIAANMGVVSLEKSFLEALRKITKSYNILLIFDEVITGFRLTFGGAQNLFEIEPDLTCLGKIIGGGLPVGAFGGRQEIMQLLAPEGNVYQAGTLSGNPVSVSAGINTLKMLKKEGPYKNLAQKTKDLCENINIKAKIYKIKLKISYIGSMFSIFFTDTDVKDYRSARSQDSELFKKFFHLLLKDNVYLSPSGFEANFLSCAHSKADLNKTLKTVEIAFKILGR